MKTLLILLIGFFGLNIAVYVHELGHFLMAILFGIEVEVFSFGMGPAFFKINRKNYEIRFSFIFFGGYCRFKGADDLRRGLELKHFDQIEEHSLYSVSAFKRILVYLAGPIANIIFAYLLLSICFMLPYYKVAHEPVVVLTSNYPLVYNTDYSAAQKAGIKNNDKILELDSTSINTWSDAQNYLRNNKKPVLFKIQRNDQIHYIKVNPFNEKEEFTGFGLSVKIDAKISKIRRDSNLYIANLREGDLILKVNDIDINNALDFLSQINQFDHSSITILRDNKEELVLDYQKEIGLTNIRSQLSFESPLSKEKGTTFFKALYKSQEFLNSILSNIKSTLTSILYGKMSSKQVLSGPLQASYVIGDITLSGFSYDYLQGLKSIFYAIGVISLSLAAGNLLPLPAFDGGGVLVSIIEGIKGSLLKPKYYIRIQITGMILMILIGLFITYGDILRF